MKFASIGDIHGRQNWKILYTDISNTDKIIFIGDYTDSFHFTGQEIIANLIEIINLKKQFPLKVELLLGNHDIQYMFGSKYRCKGYNPNANESLYRLFNDNRDLFKLAHEEQIDDKKYLWTHAGISNNYMTWLKGITRFDLDEFSDVADAINSIGLNTGEQPSIFACGYSRGGSYKHGGPLWADKRETSLDMLKGYHQIVGHTPVQDIITIEGNDNSITYIDVLHNKTQLYIMDV